jgi:hypothetical protein
VRTNGYRRGGLFGFDDSGDDAGDDVGESDP